MSARRRTRRAPTVRHRASPGPGRGVGLRHGKRDDGRRPVGQRQHGHALERDLVDDREVRERALLQRRQRLRQRARLELARPHHRDDDRGLGQPDERWGWQTLLVKERPGELVYGLYANTDANRPQSQVTIGNVARLLQRNDDRPGGLWTHLAATYDGTTERLYANGTQVAQLAVSGAIATSASPLKIGGNAIWGEWFNGLIDEVRVYNRALTPTEITADMNTAITQPRQHAAQRARHAHRDRRSRPGQPRLGRRDRQRRRRRYNVHRSTTAGFTPSTANRIAQPTGTSYIDSGLAGGNLLLQGHRRRRIRQHRACLERGQRHRQRRHDAALGALGA